MKYKPYVMYPLSGNWNSSVSILNKATGFDLQQGRYFFSLRPRLVRLWGASSFVSKVYWG